MSPTRQAPWTRALMQTLEDREWHHLDELTSIALKAIPHAHAERAGDRLRAAQRQRVGAPPLPRRKGSAYHTGLRRIVYDALSGQQRRGNAETDDEGRWRKIPCRAPTGVAHLHEQHFRNPKTGHILVKLRYHWPMPIPPSLHLDGIGAILRTDHCRYDPKQAPITTPQITTRRRK